MNIKCSQTKEFKLCITTHLFCPDFMLGTKQLLKKTVGKSEAKDTDMRNSKEAEEKVPEEQ